MLLLERIPGPLVNFGPRSDPDGNESVSHFESLAVFGRVYDLEFAIPVSGVHKPGHAKVDKFSILLRRLGCGFTKFQVRFERIQNSARRTNRIAPRQKLTLADLRG